MFRLLLVLTTLAIATETSHVQAQGFGWFKKRGFGRAQSSPSHSHQNRYHAQNGNRGYTHSGAHNGARAHSYSRRPSLFGFSFGPDPGSLPGYTAGYPDPYFLDNYGLDPWARGSFRAPDLLDDPYFYDRVPAQHRRTPGRYSHQRVPQETYRTMRPAVRYQSETMVAQSPTNSSPLIRSLRIEGDRLRKSLENQKGGELWSAYLAPHHLADLAQSGNISDLKMLLQRFDGAIDDQELNSVVGVKGFVETRNLLSQYVSEATLPSRVPTAPVPTAPVPMAPSNLPVEIPAPVPTPQVLPLPEPQPATLPESLPLPSSIESIEV